MSLFCPSPGSSFLRANGNFVCWDDAGSDTVIQPYSEMLDMSLVRTGEEPRREMVERLGEGRLPRPSVCPGCICLARGPAPAYDFSIVDVMQVEPSARCELRCIACASEEERLRLAPPLDLSPDRFRSVLGDLKAAGITVSNFDFSGHGEPLRNPMLCDLIAMSREFYPDAFSVLLTNGHGDPGPEIVECGLDEVHVAIDGVDQESYGQYRIGGDFGRAWNFLEYLSRSSDDHSRPRVVWRYILFDHNDGTAQLRQAWKMARETCMDEIRFIFTSMGRWSRELRRRTRVRGRRGVAPVVTADYCRIEAEDLRGFLELAARHLSGGSRDDARDILRHVERLAARPAAHNPDHDPDSMLASLGDLYSMLRSATTGVCE